MKSKNIKKSMTQIVERRMTHYKNDFYEYDVNRIETERPREFVWLVRDTGTHIMTDVEAKRIGGDNWFYFYEVFKGVNTWFYYVRLYPDGSGEITLSEKRCDEFASRMATRKRSA